MQGNGGSPSTIPVDGILVHSVSHVLAAWLAQDQLGPLTCCSCGHVKESYCSE